MAAAEVAAQVAAPAAEAPEVAQVQVVDGLAQNLGGVHIEQGQGQGQMLVPESDLHRACAEGNLDGVRACLTASLEALETLDMATGCTPIVLAIRGNHYDVVRELLSAGAIVPPPGLTNDPGMLSILYPPHMYGMQQFMPNMQGPVEFYPQSAGGPMYGQQPGQGGPQGGFYPQERMYEQGPGAFGGPQMHQPPFHGHGHGHGHGGRDRKGSRSEAAGQLPPMEVAKMIPCRNFPQCKYGNGCAFYHPNRPPFYAQGPAPGPGPNGFGYEAYPAFQQGGFAPQEEGAAQEAIPEGQEGVEGSAPAQVSEEGATPAPTGDDQPHQATGPTFQPNQPAFVPMSNRRQSFNQFAQPGMPGKPFGHGKKPSFSGGPRPFAPRASGGGDFGKWKDGMPPPCVFFAQGKCRNGEMCKFPHIDAEGNDCRHPDIIKGLIAPVPTGRRPPRTSFGYPPSGPGPMHPAAMYDPVQRQQQLAFLQQQRAAVQQSQNGSASSGSATPAIPTAPGPPVQPVTASTAEGVVAPVDASAVSQTPSPSNATEATTMGDSQTLVASTPDIAAGKVDNDTANTETTPASAALAPASAQVPAAANLPIKPATAAAIAPAVARSASQPGMPRAPAGGAHGRGPFAHPNARRPGPGRPFVNGNGNNGRSASTEGHVRQNGAHARGANGNNQANANGNGNNNSNAGNGNAKAAAAARQKVPGADDFPALGGLGQKIDSKQSSPVASGRTAAQVLSAPAPEKPKEEFRPKEVKETKEAKKEESAEDEASSIKILALHRITMDSDNESDGVIITCKPSTGNTAPGSGSSSPVKKAAPLSFASIAGALGGAAKSEATTPAAVDAAPVAVKA